RNGRQIRGVSPSSGAGDPPRPAGRRPPDPVDISLSAGAWTLDRGRAAIRGGSTRDPRPGAQDPRRHTRRRRRCRRLRRAVPVSGRDLRDRIRRRARHAEIHIDPPLLAGLESYYQLLAKWNAKVNLTAFPLSPAGEDEAVDRLLLERSEE